MGEYGLGIDLGTRYTAAAITAGGAVEAVRLGGRRAEIPSMLFRRDDGEVLIGEAARVRGESEPARLVDDLADDPTLLEEPVAAAARARPGGLVAVYDLGAGFDATVLRRTAEGAEILATERVTGVDFDRMVFDHVRAGLDFDASAAPVELARLRRECAEPWRASPSTPRPRSRWPCRACTPGSGCAGPSWKI
jgi:molecular chaperone DnaK (HSP70)